MSAYIAARLAGINARSHYDARTQRVILDALTEDSAGPMSATRAVAILNRARDAEQPERNPLDADGRPVIEWSAER